MWWWMFPWGWGRGRGWRWMYWLTGLPGWARFPWTCFWFPWMPRWWWSGMYGPWYWTPYGPMMWWQTQTQFPSMPGEVEMLKQMKEKLQRQLQEIEKRLKELK